MSILGTIADGIFIALQVLIGVTSAYLATLAFFGLRHKKEVPASPPQKSFAVIVAAHNEEEVIEPLIDNLKKMDYPSELYDIYVICDNCTDNTAQIVRNAGAIACERFDDSRRGKGYAIEWMLDRLWEQEKQYDAVVMFDADNLVATDFLRHMNEKLLKGDRVIQGYLDTKNPYDSWIAISYAISYYFTNRMWQLPRFNLGLANALGGTGICIDTPLLKEMGWGAHSLTEDVEFTARCVERGIYPTWAHDAIVYDEKPNTLKASWNQRMRWMQGHFDCASRFLIPLLAKSIKTRNWAMLDAALYLFQPMRLLIILLITIILYLQLVMPEWWAVTDIQEILFPTEFWTVVSILIYGQLPLAMILEKANWRAYLGLVMYPIFLITWFPITVIAFFTKNNKTWSHTVHSRGIRVEELSR
ncbi:glycosyltransferase family 2 protein [Effusibacillus lacus]|uniref:Glycosyl transferase family 2 n=1 Tax=Effusibacillus lacus TaxID=1348429 RepID=A0A292YM77_9BACL|nr:glycosyltransferase family 2 protein [Effusibacillus lacus]TCS71247.1 cellulose synthase/poly-beta-1,6-N-acetylglucosamine synthase-like glycosyltransferase [Effusibacillus lacus]GAX89873.1 glycosyl transferase family 2 [Effusibacillus lacus]